MLLLRLCLLADIPVELSSQSLYVCIASSPGHSQILSHSCISPQLRDKIWEWPGDKGRFVQAVITSSFFQGIGKASFLSTIFQYATFIAGGNDPLVALVKCHWILLPLPSSPSYPMSSWLYVFSSSFLSFRTSIPIPFHHYNYT